MEPVIEIFYFNWTLQYFPTTAITNYHTLGDLEQW